MVVVICRVMVDLCLMVSVFLLLNTHVSVAVAFVVVALTAAILIIIVLMGGAIVYACLAPYLIASRTPGQGKQLIGEFVNVSMGWWVDVFMGALWGVLGDVPPPWKI